MADELLNPKGRYCNACEWRGSEEETVHPKHCPEELLCPECHETTGVEI